MRNIHMVGIIVKGRRSADITLVRMRYINVNVVPMATITMIIGKTIPMTSIGVRVLVSHISVRISMAVSMTDIRMRAVDVRYISVSIYMSRISMSRIDT